MEKLKRIVVITSPFEHSSELVVSHRMTGKRGSYEPGQHLTKRSVRAQNREMARIGEGLRQEIAKVAADPGAHLVLNNVTDDELLAHAQLVSKERVSQGYDEALERRVAALPEGGLARLRLVGMGEYATACATATLVDILSGIHQQRGVLVPLGNLRIEPRGSFYSEDLVRGSLERLSKPELEGALQAELDSVRNTIKEMIEYGETGLGRRRLKPLLDDPHIILPREEFDALRRSHWDGRMAGLRKLAKKSGWTDKQLSHPRAERTLGGILLGAFGAEAGAEKTVRGKGLEGTLAEAQLRRRYRSVGMNYMVEQLRKQKPGK